MENGVRRSYLDATYSYSFDSNRHDGKMSSLHNNVRKECCFHVAIIAIFWAGPLAFFPPNFSSLRKQSQILCCLPMHRIIFMCQKQSPPPLCSDNTDQPTILSIFIMLSRIDIHRMENALNSAWIKSRWFTSGGAPCVYQIYHNSQRSSNWLGYWRKFKRKIDTQTSTPFAFMAKTNLFKANQELETESHFAKLFSGHIFSA